MAAASFHARQKNPEFPGILTLPGGNGQGHDENVLT
jgi:hypothetical protein